MRRSYSSEMESQRCRDTETVITTYRRFCGQRSRPWSFLPDPQPPGGAMGGFGIIVASNKPTISRAGIGSRAPRRLQTCLRMALSRSVRFDSEPGLVTSRSLSNQVKRHYRQIQLHAPSLNCPKYAGNLTGEPNYKAAPTDAGAQDQLKHQEEIP